MRAVFGHDADVGQQRHRQPGADRHAVDRRDDRLVEVDHVVDDVGGLAQVRAIASALPAVGLHHAEVAAGRERLAGAGDHGDARAVVGVDGAPDLGQLPVQAGVGRVHHLGPVERDEQHAVRPALEAEVLVVGVVHDGSPPVGCEVRPEASTSAGRRLADAARRAPSRRRAARPASAGQVVRAWSCSPRAACCACSVRIGSVGTGLAAGRPATRGHPAGGTRACRRVPRDTW